MTDGALDGWLLPARALWWPERHLLMASDLHLAKAEHFRSPGIQIPDSGSFTGMHALRPRAGSKVFSIADQTVMGPYGT